MCILLTHKRKKPANALAKKLSLRLCGNQIAFVGRSRAGRHGELIQVARFGESLACGWIDLAPGRKIYLLKESGCVTATLTAANYPRAGTRWVQMDNNFSLQNILAALFGGSFPPDS